MRIIVLGAGLVGGPIAIDLSKDKHFEVSVCDISQQALERLSENYNIDTVQKDLSAADNIKRAIKDFDLVVSAVPGFMGFKTLKTIIESGKNVVDIAFFPEDPFLLDDLAKETGVTAIVDCGVAPGMSNILTAYAADKLDEVDTAIIYVGGLPQIRQWPYEYKAVFSPVDVIEEYTRPAHYIENGHLVVRPALSDRELINFHGIGTLEAFNSDGLRTMAKTIKAKNLKEKTLRYPGHAEKISILRHTGFFSKEKIEIDGHWISPLEFTAKLLFPKWKLMPGEEDITVMQIKVDGFKDEKEVSYTYDLLDRYDKSTGIHSMARTTGYTAAMAARMLYEKLYKTKGISPPEYIGEHPECVNFILNGLRDRGVNYSETVG